MPTSLAKIDVWNMTLDLLKEAPLTTTADSKSVARWLSRNYDNARDALMQSHPWNFCRTRKSVAADATDPDFGWDHRYALPTNCLRVLHIGEYGDWGDNQITFEVEIDATTDVQYILSDQTGPIYVHYIRRVTTEAAWSPMFAEALAAKLAWSMAHWLTGKASYGEVAGQRYAMAVKEAKRADGLEGTPERQNIEDIITIRNS